MNHDHHDHPLLGQEGRDWAVVGAATFVVLFFLGITVSCVLMGYGFALSGILLLFTRLVLLFFRLCGALGTVIGVIGAFVALLRWRFGLAYILLAVAVFGAILWVVTGAALMALAPFNPSPPPGTWGS